MTLHIEIIIGIRGYFYTNRGTSTKYLRHRSMGKCTTIIYILCTFRPFRYTTPRNIFRWCSYFRFRCCSIFQRCCCCSCGCCTMTWNMEKSIFLVQKLHYSLNILMDSFFQNLNSLCVAIGGLLLLSFDVKPGKFLIDGGIVGVSLGTLVLYSSEFGSNFNPYNSKDHLKNLASEAHLE